MHSIGVVVSELVSRYEQISHVIPFNWTPLICLFVMQVSSKLIKRESLYIFSWLGDWVQQLRFSMPTDPLRLNMMSSKEVSELFCAYFVIQLWWTTSPTI